MHDPKYEVGYENGYAAGYIDGVIRVQNAIKKFVNDELVERAHSGEPMTIAKAVAYIKDLPWEYEKALKAAERSKE